jgi:hypothetical protein
MRLDDEKREGIGDPAGGVYQAWYSRTRFNVRLRGEVEESSVQQIHAFGSRAMTKFTHIYHGSSSTTTTY